MASGKSFLSFIKEIPDGIRAWRGGAKAAERIEPAAEGAAKTAAKTEAAAGKAVEKMSDATKRAIADVNEHLSSLTPGRVGKEHLDDRLKALGESAKQHDLVDASVRTGRDQLSAKAALEKLKNGEKVTPKEFSDVQASITNDFIKYEKKVAKPTQTNAGGNLSGMSPLAKYGLLGSVAATIATYGFTALTGDDPNDSADNNLTHIQRLRYKFDKSFSKEGGEQIQLAMNATTTNSEKDLKIAQAGEADATLQRAASASKIAPTVDMSGGLLDEGGETANVSSVNGKLIADNLKHLYREGYLKDWEAQTLASKWRDVTKAPVGKENEFETRNVASNQELADFRSEMDQILQNPTVGRSPEAAGYVADLVLKMR